jgi:predicted nucleic acid-binding protein
LPKNTGLPSCRLIFPSHDVLQVGIIIEGRPACYAVNVSEVYTGMRQEERKTEALSQGLDYYKINWEVVKRAGLLKRDYSKKGQTLLLTDTTITTVALEYNLTLITDNVKHYPMPQLKLYPLA